MRRVCKGPACFNVNTESVPRYQDFWTWYESPTWEADTVEVFTRYLQPDTRYVDFGAWIGPTVLLAANLVAQVLCVEPDPVARAELTTNLSLNPELSAKVKLFDFAVAGDDGSATLSSPTEGGDSTSSLFRPGAGSTSWVVQKVGIQSFMARQDVGRIDFIKMDVEGAEYEIIPAMASYIREKKPSLYISMHPNFLFDKSSPSARLKSGLRLIGRNRSMLKALMPYKHHYVYDVNEAIEGCAGCDRGKAAAAPAGARVPLEGDVPLHGPGLLTLRPAVA